MAKDYTKLQKFVEAAITNWNHPVYRLGMSHSPILQHYALNVKMGGSGILEVVEPKDWFAQYPEWTAKLEAVMQICEEDTGTVSTVAEADLAALKAENEDLKKKLADKDKKVSNPPVEDAEEKPAETPEGE